MSDLGRLLPVRYRMRKAKSGHSSKGGSITERNITAASILRGESNDDIAQIDVCQLLDRKRDGERHTPGRECPSVSRKQWLSRSSRPSISAGRARGRGRDA